MITQEGGIYLFSQEYIQDGHKQGQAVGISFAYYSRKNMTFKKDLKTVQQAIPVKQSSYTLSLHKRIVLLLKENKLSQLTNLLTPLISCTGQQPTNYPIDYPTKQQPIDPIDYPINYLSPPCQGYQYVNIPKKQEQ